VHLGKKRGLGTDPVRAQREGVCTQSKGMGPGGPMMWCRAHLSERLSVQRSSKGIKEPIRREVTKTRTDFIGGKSVKCGTRPARQEASPEKGLCEM